MLVVTTGCLSQEDRDRAAVAAQIHDQVVHGLSVSDALAAVTDFRDLAEPSEELRELFAEQSAVPRLVAAERDRAVLAVWRRAEAGPEPFNANRTAVGAACVELTRTATGVQAVASDCPRPLRPEAPDAETVGWTPGDDAVAATGQVAASLGEEVRWMLFRNDDATAPRTQARDADDIASALSRGARDLGSAERRFEVATSEWSEGADTVTAAVLITAEVSDPTDAEGTVTATCRYALEADLTIASADGHHNWQPLELVGC